MKSSSTSPPKVMFLHFFYLRPLMLKRNHSDKGIRCVDISSQYFTLPLARLFSEMDKFSPHNFFSNLSKPHSTFQNATMQRNATGNYTNDQLIEDILFEVLGPKRSPFFLPVTLAYILIFLVGLSGNLLTCAVIAKHKKMRNPTNFYLVSLAASDLIVLLFGMPLEIYDLWQNYPFPFGEGGCYFKTFLFETVCFASILNVTALSVERYMAVVHPLKTRYLSTNKHAKQVITVVWVVSMACAIPNTLLHGIFYLPEWMDESAICTVLKPLWIYSLVIQITTVCFYFVPMMVISVLYLVMGVHLCRERRKPLGNLGKNCSSSNKWQIHVENGRRRQVTKMLSEFVLCLLKQVTIVTANT